MFWLKGQKHVLQQVSLSQGVHPLPWGQGLWKVSCLVGTRLAGGTGLQCVHR